MTLNDPLANMFSKIENAERIGMNGVELQSVSTLTRGILKILNDAHYVGKIKDISTQRGVFLHVDLLGNINKCGVIKPRHSVAKDNYDKFESRYLPAKDFGILVVSTPQGLMTHLQARDKKIGGKLVCYCY